jgi:hypothetical protein
MGDEATLRVNVIEDASALALPAVLLLRAALASPVLEVAAVPAAGCTG